MDWTRNILQFGGTGSHRPPAGAAQGYWIYGKTDIFGGGQRAWVLGVPPYYARRKPSRLGRIFRRVFTYATLGFGTFSAGWLLGRFATLGYGIAGAAVTGAVSSGTFGLMLLKDFPRLAMVPITLASGTSLLAGGLTSLGFGKGLMKWARVSGYIPPPGDLEQYIYNRIRRAGRRGITGWGN